MATLYTSWLHCIIAYLSLFGLGRVGGLCPEHESLMLLQLKDSLDFDSSLSLKLVNWNSSTDCCLWPGVDCSESEQYVTALDLSNECIQGGLNLSSSPLFDLQRLTNLSLADNSLNTSIPSGFGKLTKLMHLDLYRAGFKGQIPVEISNLTRLVTLDLSSNDLEVKNPNLQMLIGNLSKLVELCLDQIDLSTQTDVWSQVLPSSVPNLQALSLSSCRLSGSIHASLENLTSLSHIDLSSNNFSVPLPQCFSNLKNLTSLNLRSCEFSGVFPNKMLQMQTLKYVDLSLNPLQGKLPVFFDNSSLERLVLRETMFSGTVPKSIVDLKLLSELDLSSCHFIGSLPDSIGQLTTLSVVDLSYNSFSGPLPSFTSFINLTSLRLDGNRLTGSLLSTNWNKLPQLYYLSLRNNFLSGSIPTSIYGLNTLQHLDLSFNQFNETIRISSLHQLQELVYLDLSHNKLGVEFDGKDIPSFLNLLHLGLASCKLKALPDLVKTSTYVDLSENQIHGEIPNWFWDIETRNYLNLSHNFLQKLNIPSNLSRSMQFIDLGHNQFEGEIPLIFPTAIYLDLSSNKFSGTIPSTGSVFNDLVVLSLSNNNLCGGIPKWICSATTLKVLDLSNNTLNGTIPSCLMQLPNMRVMKLMANNIGGIIPDSFPSNCSLNAIHLNENALQGTVPITMGHCTSLQVLDLGYNKIHDTFPCWMRQNPDLRILVLRSNLFSGGFQCSYSRGFPHWTRLQILDIASNQFSGNLPSQQLLSWKAMQPVDKESSSLSADILELKFNFGGFHYVYTVAVITKGKERELPKISTVYVAIDFSDNQFEGKIPYEFGYLKALRALNISGNRLSGRISSCIGNLKNLEALDLSRNELSGSIPTELALLTELSSLNLSFNQLEGRIPTGNQIQTLSEESFKGNKGLCGFPLHKECIADAGTESSFSKPLSDIGGDFFIAVEVGYALGLGFIIIPLILWPRWRIKFYGFIDSVTMKIYFRRFSIITEASNEWSTRT